MTAQPVTTSHQLLDRLTSSRGLSAADIDELIASQVPEDLYLDYKDGRFLENPTKAAQRLREYVSAFANSAGGVLIVGIEEKDDKPYKVTGCPRIGRRPLSTWARSCISGMAGTLYPSPAFHVVSHPNGDVLVCVVYRSPNLVPVIVEGKPTYYMRFHDETRPVPDYLIADLLLGRRNQPSLEITSATLVKLRNVDTPIPHRRNLELELRVQIENTNFVWAEESIWGLLAYLADKPVIRTSGWGSTSISQTMRQQTAASEPLWIPNKLPYSLVHYTDEAHVDRPFTVGQRSVIIELPLFMKEVLQYSWQAAVYLVARNSAPFWYQLAFRVDSDVFNSASQGKSLPKTHPGLTCERAQGRPPLVTWRPLTESGANALARSDEA